jgi:hypothetical protein
MEDREESRAAMSGSVGFSAAKNFSRGAPEKKNPENFSGIKKKSLR